MFTKSVMSSNYLILCRSLLLLPSIFPSIRVFSNELAFCIWCPKYWMDLLVSVSLPRSCGQMSKFSRPCTLEFPPHAHWCLGEHPDVETREGTKCIMRMRLSSEMPTSPFLIQPPPGGEQGRKSLTPQGSGPRSPFGRGTTLGSHYDVVLGNSNCPYTSNIY